MAVCVCQSWVRDVYTNNIGRPYGSYIGYSATNEGFRSRVVQPKYHFYYKTVWSVIRNVLRISFRCTTVAMSASWSF